MAKNREKKPFEVSIDDREIIELANRDINYGEGYFSENIQPKIEEYYQIYRGDPERYRNIMPRLDSKSKFIDTAVLDTVEWMMPTFMKLFFQTSDVVSLQGRTEEDVDSARNMQKLINYQINNQNDGFLTFYQWIKNALISGLGWIKVHWQRDTEYRNLRQDVSEDTLMQMRMETENIEVTDVEPAVEEGLYTIYYRKKQLKENKPVLEVLMPYEVIYDPSAKSIQECAFVIHRTQKSVDWLRRRGEDGTFKNVEKAVAGEGEGDGVDSTFDYLDDSMHEAITGDSVTYMRDTGHEDTPRKKVTLYELYTKMDVNEDGFLEDVIITIVNNVVVRVQENTFERYPFFNLGPLPEPGKIFAQSIPGLLGQLQDLKTGVIREMLINIAYSNDNKMLVREDAVNLGDIAADRQAIRVKPGVENVHNVVVPYPHKPLQQSAFSMMEYVDHKQELRAGITRYNQGVDVDSLNPTATGVTKIMNAAAQRIWLIATIFAETGVKPLFRFLVEANQKFIDQAQIVRLTGERLKITPEDLQGNYDIEVDAGVGINEKQEKIQTLQYMLQWSTTNFLKLGLTRPEQIYNIAKELYYEMGKKNASDYLIDPQQAPQAQMQNAQEQQLMEAIENGMGQDESSTDEGGTVGNPTDSGSGGAG